MARTTSSNVFFPWERRRGVFGLASRARIRLAVAAILVVAFLFWIRARERDAAAVRATRASITTATNAVMSYRADHAGKCPPNLDELVHGGYARNAPLDAWGRPLRLTCPGRRDAQGFELESDGPDGVPGGLDRVD